MTIELKKRFLFWKRSVWKPARFFRVATSDGKRAHSGWGNQISWHSTGQGGLRVLGFLVARPNDGDALVVPMRSGKVGAYKFCNVELMRDPPDMFFADAYFMCYVDDDGTPDVVQRALGTLEDGAEEDVR